MEGIPDIKKLFQELNKQHFNGVIKDIPVLWNTRMRTTAGICTYTRKRENFVLNLSPSKIELSSKLFANNNYDIDKIKRTLIHEMVHAFLVQEYNETGHTARFQKMMTEITGERKNHRCHNYNTEGLRNKAKYKIVCPVHGEIGTRNRKPKKGTYRCTKCRSVIKFEAIEEINNFWSL